MSCQGLLSPRAWTGRTPRALRSWRLEELEPPTDNSLQPLALEPVDHAPTLTPNTDDARRFEDMEVPRRRRPAVREALGEVSRRQLGPVVREQLDDVASDLVRQGVEDHLVLRERGSMPRHREKISLCANNVQRRATRGSVRCDDSTVAQTNSASARSG